jgi:hypothetical protein
MPAYLDITENVLGVFIVHFNNAVYTQTRKFFPVGLRMPVRAYC